VTETIDEAYRTCELISRTQARNFFYGIRLLPTAKRNGLCALYALSRRMDDIGDGDLPYDAKVAALGELRAELRSIDTSTDPVLIAVNDTVRRYPVPLHAFDELIDGVEMDVAGREYATFDDLVGYCRCVAGAVGRLCLGVFSAHADPLASADADALGIALQQTNILRDIREDLLNGRTYLPQEDLDRFDVTLKIDEHGALADPDGGLAELIRFAAARNRDWYERGWRLLPRLDRRSSACTAAMSGIYRRLLDRIDTDPQAVYTQRLSLSGWSKIGVALGALTRTVI
jgi:15-cis-phytoene synthase